MKCSKCRHENRVGAKFCEECAAPLARACANCGASLSPTAKFCPECGHATGLAPRADSERQRFVSPKSYTPRHLAERILTSKTALEGERKQVTVLFADLKGSMELLADRDPEDARKLLDPVLERMMEAVHRYEGTVNQVMGDGIMALFGAPLAHEDHGVRACYAALRMQETVRRYADEVHRSAGVPLHIRVGVNSGEVVVRSIGSDLHMDYSAVGQTTHLAARLEQMAMPGSILISPHTLAFAEGYVLVKPLGQRPVKGLETPLEVFEVVGASTARSRLQAAAARGLTRFVGRDRELEQLRQAQDLAGMGRGQVVAFVGDPGVGKSRLFWEFTQSHRTEGWLIVESVSVSYGKATAFLPLIELLRAFFQIEAADDKRKIREKVTGKLLSLDRMLEHSLLALLWLLEVAVDDPQWQRLDPPERRSQTLDGIKRLLLRESQVQPLVLVFEDLHWIDVETQAFLDNLMDSLPSTRVLLLVNYRPEYQHSWGSKTYYRQLRVDPLPPESADELLNASLGNDAALEPLKRLLIERTEGNPFFLEETVRTLVETQVLAGERGAYRLTKTALTLQIPATTQAILAARIDRLELEDKRLLQAASVFGKDVPFRLLQAISEGSEEVLRGGLANLQAAEFLYEARLFPDLEYTFKHALTQEVVYGSILSDRRRELHALIVKAIEGLYPDRAVEHAEKLAYHALRGEVWAKAHDHAYQAGVKALSRASYREAAGNFEPALAALEKLPSSPDTIRAAIDRRLDLRTALNPLGELRRTFELLTEAEKLARAIEDRQRLGWVSMYLCTYFSFVPDDDTNRDRAIDFGQQALKIAIDLDEVNLQVGARYYLGQAYWGLGDFRQGAAVLRGNLSLVQGDRRYERFGLGGIPIAQTHGVLAQCLAELGQFSEAGAAATEGIRIASAVHHLYSLTVTHFWAGHVHLVRGESHLAISFLEQSLDFCRRGDFPLLYSAVISRLGYAKALTLDVTGGIDLLQQAAEGATAIGVVLHYPLILIWSGEAYLMAGLAEKARELAGRALESAQLNRQRAHEAYALQLFGKVDAASEPRDIERSGHYYLQALALAEALGMRPLAAKCHLDLHGLHRQADEGERAEKHLTAATTMLRDMDMRSWLAKAEALRAGGQR